MNPLNISSKQSSSCSNLQLPSIYASRQCKQSRMKKHKILACTGFEQKLRERHPLMSIEQYRKWSSQQINSQYHELKQELRKISDKLNGLIESKQVCIERKKNNELVKLKSPSTSHLTNYSSLQQSTLNPSASATTFIKNPNTQDNIYQGYEKNNSKIFSNNKHQLQKLLKREEYILHSTNPNGLKQELIQKISLIKQEIKEQKKCYKQLTLQSQKVGHDIINTDKLIEQIRILQKQLDVLLLRKKKLQNQHEKNQKNQQIIQQGTTQITSKQSKLIQYQTQKKNSFQKAKTQQELKTQMSKKLRIIAALKRDKQAKDKINAKKYYQLLTQLNDIQKRSQTYPNKFNILETKIQLTSHDYEDFKIQFDQLMQKRKLQKQKSSKKNNESSFLTQLQNIQQVEDLHKTTFYQSKQNLQQNKINEKQLLKEIEQNLQKTQKNLDKMQKKMSPRTSQVQNEIDAIINEQEQKENLREVTDKMSEQVKEKVTKSHNKKHSDLKKYEQFQDSSILQDPEQYENSNQIQQLEQRFRENETNSQKKDKVKKMRV